MKKKIQKNEGKIIKLFAMKVSGEGMGDFKTMDNYPNEIKKAKKDFELEAERNPIEWCEFYEFLHKTEVVFAEAKITEVKKLEDTVKEWNE